MICETCFKNQATVALVVRVMTVQREYRMCERCATLCEKRERKYTSTPLPRRELSPEEHASV